MSLTVRRAAQSLLTYVEKYNVDELYDAQAEGPGTDEEPNELYGYLPDVVDTLNATRQEIAGLWPSHISREDWGGLIKPPTPVQFSGSINAQVLLADESFWDSWMEGCSVKFSGSSIEFNTFVKTSTSMGDTFVHLKYPIDFETGGTITGTVYHDCLNLPADIVRLLNDPILEGAGGLRNRASFKDLYSTYRPRDARDFGFYRSRTRLVSGDYKIQVGRPSAYWANRNQPPIRIYLHPLPDAAGAISASVLMGPTPYVMSDISLGTETPEPSRELDLPSDWDELYFLPLAKLRYASSPFWKNPDVVPHLAEQAKVAREALARMRPQAVRSFFRAPRI